MTPWEPGQSGNPAGRSHVEKLARDGAEVDVLLGALAVSSLSDRVVEEQPLP